MTKENSESEVQTSQSKPEQGQRIFTYKASTLIWLALYVVEILIALRIILDFMTANPDSPIVNFIHGLTAMLLFPFEGLIAPITIGGKALEVSWIFAMGVYALAAVATERLVWLIFYRPRRQATTVTETTASEHHINP
jgi:uncharacterized protein YggT (Ycf19 family)